MEIREQNIIATFETLRAEQFQNTFKDTASTVRDYEQAIEEAQSTTQDFNTDLNKSAKNIKASTASIAGALKGVKENSKQIFDETGVKAYNERLKDNAKRIRASLSETLKLNKGQRELAQQVGNSISRFKIFGTSLGEIRENLIAQRDGFKGFIQGLSGATKGSRALGIALKAGLGVFGLLLGALGALATAFQRSERLTNLVEQAWAGLTAGVTVLLDRVTLLGEALFDFFNGDYEAASNNISAAFSNVGTAIKEQATLAATLKRNLQDINREAQNIDIANSASARRLKELNFITENITKSDKERVAAAKEFNRLNEEIAKREKENEQRRLATTLGFTELSKEALSVIQQINETGFEGLGDSINGITITPQLRDQIAAEIQNVNNLEAAFFETQTTNNNKLNQLQSDIASQRRKRIEDEIKRREAEEQNRLKAEEQINKLQLGLVEDSAQKRIFILREAAKVELEEFKGNEEQKVRFASALQAQLNKDVQAIIDQSNAEIKQKEQQLQNDLEAIRKQALIDIEADEKEREEKVKAAALNSLNNTLFALEAEKIAIEEQVFNGTLSREEADLRIAKIEQQQLERRVKFADITQAQQLALELQLIQQKQKAKDQEAELEAKRREKELADEKALAKAKLDIAIGLTKVTAGILEDAFAKESELAKKRVEVQKERVEEALRVAEQGGQNNVDIERERLDQLNQARQQSLQQQRRAAAFQALLNQRETISAAVTGVAKAFRDGGNPLQLAVSVGSFLAALAAVRSAVNSEVSSIPSFAVGNRGLKTSDGIPQSDGSLLVKAHRDERIMKAKQSVAIANLSDDQIVEYATIGQKIGNFNSLDYIPNSNKGIPLNPALVNLASTSLTGNTIPAFPAYNTHTIDYALHKKIDVLINEQRNTQSEQRKTQKALSKMQTTFKLDHEGLMIHGQNIQKLKDRIDNV